MMRAILKSSGCLIMLAYSALATCAQAIDQTARSFTFEAERVVAIGDVHGAFEALQRLLRSNQLIDGDNRWIAGTTHLVSLGDMLDRGARSREVMDLFRDLQGQASAAGGKVHVLLGNHESMNLLGDLRDVSDAEFASYLGTTTESDTDPLTTSPDPSKPPGFEAHRAALAPDGEYGEWLLTLPVMIKINDTLFVHGGLPPLEQQSLSALNHAALEQIRVGITSGQSTPRNAPLLDDDGPLWYRGTAACHPLLESPILASQLAAFDARRVIIGHTPTPTRRVQSRLQGRVTIIDTGMLSSVYRGDPYLLELTSNSTSVFDATGRQSTVEWWHPVLAYPPEQEIELLERIKVERIEVEGTKTPAEFLDQQWVKASKPAIARFIASWRLDRELGLWMTPLTIADANGKRYLQVVKKQWMTEGERRSSGRRSSNYCIQGHQNLLVAAFDALQGVTTRSLDSLYVHKANGSLRLAPISKSFGTSSTLPQYGTTPTIPDTMAQKLAELDSDGLTKLLGDVLSKRQIKAILTRRDKILEWPRTEHSL